MPSLRQVWEILRQPTNLQLDKRNISELYVVNDKMVWLGCSREVTLEWIDSYFITTFNESYFLKIYDNSHFVITTWTAASSQKQVMKVYTGSRRTGMATGKDFWKLWKVHNKIYIVLRTWRMRRRRRRRRREKEEKKKRWWTCYTAGHRTDRRIRDYSWKDQWFALILRWIGIMQPIG